MSLWHRIVAPVRPPKTDGIAFIFFDLNAERKVKPHTKLKCRGKPIAHPLKICPYKFICFCLYLLSAVNGGPIVFSFLSSLPLNYTVVAVLECCSNKLRNKLDDIIKVYNFPCLTLCTIRNEILKGLRSSSFWVPRNLSNHIYRPARNRNTVLAKSREMTVKSQTLPCGGGVRRRNDDCKENTCPRCCVRL